jgi:hypothetical protein
MQQSGCPVNHLLRQALATRRGFVNLARRVLSIFPARRHFCCFSAGGGGGVFLSVDVGSVFGVGQAISGRPVFLGKGSVMHAIQGPGQLIEAVVPLLGFELIRTKTNEGLPRSL